MKDQQLGRFEVRQINVNQISRMPTARPLNEDHVRVLQDSVRQCGLNQPIVVSRHGNGFVVITGNHRLAAVSRLGIEVIDAVVLPDGMKEDELLLRSLHENHVRRDESIQATLDRVQALSQVHKCSLSAAAKLARVTPGTLSKLQKIVKSLSPAALKVIRECKIGNAIAYDVARYAKDEQQQVEWLKAHAAGRMSREDIKQTATDTKTRTTKKLRIDVTLGDIEVRVSVPNALGYDILLESIASLRSQIMKQRKREIAFELLPKVLR